MDLSTTTLARLNKFRQSDKYNNLSMATKNRLDGFLSKNTSVEIPKQNIFQKAITPLISEEVAKKSPAFMMAGRTLPSTMLMGGPFISSLVPPNLREQWAAKQMSEQTSPLAIGSYVLPFLPKGAGVIGRTTRRILKPTGEAGALAKTGAFIAGVDKEILAETAKIGYRNVLNKKYYNAKIPEILATRIEGNVANLENAAKTEFNIITNPLKDIPFNFKDLKNQILALARQLRTNPFKGPSKDLNMNIIDGVSKAKVKNIGDVLDLRRNLDEVLYTAKGQGIKSSFGKAVRDKFNEILHQNDILKGADEMWTNLQNILRENKRVMGETGESYLKRWANLTAKQKNALVLLEKKSGGEPFVQDLTNWSLAKEFLAKPGIRGGIFNAIQKTAHPLLRAGLRAGGVVEKGKQLLFRKP